MSHDRGQAGWDAGTPAPTTAGASSGDSEYDDETELDELDDIIPYHLSRTNQTEQPPPFM